MVNNPMYSVLIVDDDFRIREGLTYYVSWENMGFKKPSVAKNFEEAIRLLLSYQYHVLITDLKLPDGSGLNICNFVRQYISLTMPILILSAYNEFSYAREALQYNVKDFVPKPTNLSLFSNSISEIKKDLDHAENTMNLGTFKSLEWFEKVIRRILCHQVLTQSILNVETLKQVLKKKFPSQYYGIVVYPSIYRELLYSFYDTQSGTYYFEGLLKGLDIAIWNSNESDMGECLKRTCLSIDNELPIFISPSVEEYSQLLNFGNQINKFIENISKSEGLPNFSTTISDDGSELLSIAVKETLNYIKQNYKTDLCLNNIANEVYLSPSYLSRLFKQETGTSLTNYIRNYRLYTALELLLSSDAPITEIAKNVGFNDPKYFSQQFKKILGYSPREYRNLRGI